MKSWKTNLFAGLIMVSQIGGALGLPPKVVQAATAICTIGGLAAAKDNNVTGGTKQQ